MTHRRTLATAPTLFALGFLFLQGIAGSPAAAQVFHDDWTTTPADSFPDSVKVLNGAAVLGMHGGQRVIRVLPTGRRFNWTVLEFRLNDMLPQDFTIEFDLHAPLSTSYPLEIRAGLQGDPLAYLGATARANRVVARCGAVSTGIYGNLETTLTERQDRWDTTGVHRCRVAVTGSRMEVSYHNVSLAKDGIDFKRSRRLVMVVPASEGMEAHIGPLTISGPSSTAGVVPTTPPDPSTGSGTSGGGATGAPPQPAPAPAARGAGHVTGGGWITLPGNVRANFGFVVHGGPAPTGNFQLSWRAAGAGGSNTFHAKSFATLTAGPTTTFSGSGTLNGQSTHTFIVTVVEGNPRTMQIQMTPAAGGITDTGARPVEGGNITVHR
jgi:hypothetical protein